MRTAFIDTLFDLARVDPRIMLLVGDLGFGVVTRFQSELPRQFVNAGVAEQNMTGLAAGLALSGKIVFTYSIANFPVMRCLEQIRNDVCYHRANVKITAVGVGMAYGPLGMSHHATEDIAIMRALPNMVVLAPGDSIEAAFATRAAVAHDGPFYLRLGRADEPRVHETDAPLEFGKAIQLRDGGDATLVVTGGLLANVLEAASILARQGVRTRVLSMHTVKPLDEAAILAAARETGAIFAVEEHSIIGGLGGAVAEVLAEALPLAVRFKRIGLNDAFPSIVGDQKYLRAKYGLDAPGIARTVANSLRAARPVAPGT
jgi:transketolase